MSWIWANADRPFGRGAVLLRRARRPLHPSNGAEGCTLARPSRRSPTNSGRLGWAARCLPGGGKHPSIATLRLIAKRLWGHRQPQ